MMAMFRRSMTDGTVLLVLVYTAWVAQVVFADQQAAAHAGHSPGEAGFARVSEILARNDGDLTNDEMTAFTVTPPAQEDIDCHFDVYERNTVGGRCRELGYSGHVKACVSGVYMEIGSADCL